MKHSGWILSVLFGGALASGVLMAGSATKREDYLVVDPDPVGMNISHTYAVNYSKVMDWHGQNHSFDDIILALETSDLLSGFTPQELLRMRRTGLSWDQIWDQVELTP
ncbi:hypothetical protein KQH62_01095 [bacterium]|nr:hypothetical protein [bacterium]